MLVFLCSQLVALLYERLESESSAADGAASAGVQEGAAHLFEVRLLLPNSRLRQLIVIRTYVAILASDSFASCIYFSRSI